MTAGLLRFGLEAERYSRTGEFRPAHAFFAAFDAAAGAGGVWHSRYLFREAAALGGLPARNNAMMGLVHWPRGMRWGLRGLGMAGNVAGFGLSLHAFLNAAQSEDLPPSLRQDRMTSAGLGMLGSALMMGSMLWVTPATAPLAGVLTIGALGVFALQSVVFD